MADDFASYFVTARLTTNWASRNFEQWAALLAPHRSKPVRLLEVGAWEGQSSLFFLNYLPHASIVCIDTFAGSIEHRNWPLWRRLWQLQGIERRFKRNTAAYSSRVEMIKGDSRTALATMKLSGRSFDFIYIDGSHFAADVYCDALVGWQVLDEGGLMVFDDYERKQGREQDWPSVGIDGFLDTVQGQYVEVFRNHQLAVKKLDVNNLVTRGV